ncbi:MAG: CDP-alcohol phosphatidyltransferase family protein [Rhodothermales bacterium]|nr:CDP-alcohol phosphatidyltransferase family protein [Rhodothermales bacterium]
MTNLDQDRHTPAWPELGKFWTVPNVVTLSRIAFVIPAAVIILQDGSRMLLIGFVVAAIATDWFDGNIARWSKSVSDWGKVLDPLVDKLGGALVIVALVIKGSLPLWYIGVILLRDVLIVSGSARIARRTGQITISIWAGKVAVASVAVTVLAAILQADPPVMRFCLVVSSVLLVYSLLRYLWRYFKFIQLAEKPALPAETGIAESGLLDEIESHS